MIMSPKILRCLAPVALVVSVAVAQQVRRVDDATLKTAGKSGDDWLTYGFTLGETRYSPLDQLNPSNVKRLGLAFDFDNVVPTSDRIMLAVGPATMLLKSRTRIPWSTGAKKTKIALSSYSDRRA
jgi:glucose dehydrogenase